MTLTQALLCPYDVTRCIYDVHAEHEKAGKKATVEEFIKTVRAEIEKRLMFGLVLELFSFDADYLSSSRNVKFTLILSQNGQGDLPMIRHTLYSPKWLVD